MATSLPINYARPVNVSPVLGKTFMAFSSKTGLLTGITTGSSIVNFRTTSSVGTVITRVDVGFTTTTAFGTPQVVDFGLSIARSWTVDDSGGAFMTISGDSQKLNTSFEALSSSTVRVADTAGLTAGTRTLDTNPIRIINGWSGAVGATIPLTTIFNAQPGQQPIALAANEGILIRNLTAFGASGVGYLYFCIEMKQ